MIYWAMFFLTMLISASQMGLRDNRHQAESSNINSAVDYFDKVRGPLANFRENNLQVTGKVTLGELDIPISSNLAERDDIHLYTDNSGFYVSFNEVNPMLAAELAQKYYVSASQGDERWGLAYYSVGWKGEDGCLKTTLSYKTLDKICQLPDEIPEGTLIVTDRNN